MSVDLGVFDVRLLLDASRRVLAGVAASAPSSPLLILESGGSDLAPGAATLLANRWAKDRVFTFTPSSGRWTIPDLEGMILEVSRLESPLLTAIIMLEADIASPGVYDRLLFLLESPPSPLVVLACVESANALPPALRSRSMQVVACRPSDSMSRLEHLVSLGRPSEDAARALEVCGPLASLAFMASGDRELLTAVELVLTPNLWSPARFDEVYSALTSVSASLSKGEPVKAGVLSAQYRAQAFMVLRVAASRVERGIILHMRDSAVDGIVELDRLRSSLSQFDDFHVFGSTPAAALAFLMSLGSLSLRPVPLGPVSPVSAPSGA